MTVLNGEDAASAGDAWHLGSLTKMMTAVLAAHLGWRTGYAILAAALLDVARTRLGGGLA